MQDKLNTLSSIKEKLKLLDKYDNLSVEYKLKLFDEYDKLNMEEKLEIFLDEYIRTDRNTETATVFPLQCGVGKSNYVTHLLSECLIHNRGIIIVTDEVERLENYTNPRNERLNNIIRRNIDRIAILKADTIKNELRTLHTKKFVLMTTQRYFNLSVEEIKQLTKTRNTIVFDEKPFIIEVVELSVKNLNDISTAIMEKIDDTINQEEKDILIGTWKKCSTALQNILSENEKSNNEYEKTVWFDKNNLSVNYNLFEKFFNLIKKYKIMLTPEISKNITALEKLFTEGVITSKKKRVKNSQNDYINYFTVAISNIDKLINVGAKVFILDGTADISPEYKMSCFNVINCNEFKRDLTNLTVNIVNINTSKTRLKNNQNKALLSDFIKYINSLPETINTIFTYKQIASYFIEKGFKVNWFGNIKGTNEYRKETNICQIGLNRYKDLTYQMIVNEIFKYNEKNILKKYTFDSQTIGRYRSCIILADLEQNIYRTAIRNKDNTKKVTYTLICNVNELLYDICGEREYYTPLLDMVQNRYTQLNAKVNLIAIPEMFRTEKAMRRNTKVETNVQKFIKWYEEQPKGRIFKRKDVCKECGFTEGQFKAIKKIDLFEKCKTETSGKYIVK